jgi:hypothetical protein
MAKIMEKDITRFLSKVNKTETCWLWTAGKTGGTRVDPYGYFWFNGSMVRAHRFSWLIHNGDFDQNQYVLHKCDIPACVNPEHLFLGSGSDNVKDAYDKGRMYRKGESSGRAVLDDQKVMEIRAKYAEGKYSKTELGKQFGVNYMTITYIVNGKSWSHL